MRRNKDYKDRSADEELYKENDGGGKFGDKRRRWSMGSLVGGWEEEREETLWIQSILGIWRSFASIPIDFLALKLDSDP